MEGLSVKKYAESPLNIFGRPVSTTAVYTAIEKGRLICKEVGGVKIIYNPIAKGMIEDRVLIKPDPYPIQEFAVPEHTLPIRDTGEVVMVGAGKNGGSPMVVQVGDRVKYVTDRMQAFTHEGQLYYIVHQPDIHMVL